MPATIDHKSGEVHDVHPNLLLTLITAARISCTSRGLRSTTYSAASSFSQTMGPVNAGASLSGDEVTEDLLCRLSFDDLGLRVCVDMVSGFVQCFNFLVK